MGIICTKRVFLYFHNVPTKHLGVRLGVYYETIVYYKDVLVLPLCTKHVGVPMGVQYETCVY